MLNADKSIWTLALLTSAFFNVLVNGQEKSFILFKQYAV